MSRILQLPMTILRFLKTVFILLLYVVVMLVFVTPGAFLYLKCGKHTEKKKENLHKFIRWSARCGIALLGFFGNKFTLAGRTDEDFSRPAIITCNHQSHLDLLPMLALTPKLVILTADWVWHNPLYGFIIREADFLPASKGLEVIAPRLRELVDKGYSIAVYPESTRSLDGSIGRFHQGAFYLADQLQVDILPVVLFGAGKALPKHGRLLRRGPIRLEIDERISPEEMKTHGDTYKAQASYLRSYYISRCGESES
ncbi:MAG: 1-acyl-sn-glycerol-3-phosphate acyltransferase [Bacteroidales bacterium]|nr:1-acyl-sn-glycerol-3-phosphate acyltransferase [Bacteroidales bacterium]